MVSKKTTLPTPKKILKKGEILITGEYLHKEAQKEKMKHEAILAEGRRSGEIPNLSIAEYRKLSSYQRKKYSDDYSEKAKKYLKKNFDNNPRKKHDYTEDFIFKLWNRHEGVYTRMSEELGFSDMEQFRKIMKRLGFFEKYPPQGIKSMLDKRYSKEELIKAWKKSLGSYNGMSKILNIHRETIKQIMIRMNLIEKFPPREKNVYARDIVESKKNPSYSKQELKKGTSVEMEHTDDPKIAEQIAKDHLEEFPEYYEELLKMEKKLKLKHKINPSDDGRKRYRVEWFQGVVGKSIDPMAVRYTYAASPKQALHFVIYSDLKDFGFIIFNQQKFTCDDATDSEKCVSDILEIALTMEKQAEKKGSHLLNIDEDIPKKKHNPVDKKFNINKNFYKSSNMLDRGTNGGWKKETSEFIFKLKQKNNLWFLLKVNKKTNSKEILEFKTKSEAYRNGILPHVHNDSFKINKEEIKRNSKLKGTNKYTTLGVIG